jgi:hypothetical protein
LPMAITRGGLLKKKEENKKKDRRGEKAIKR